MNKENELNYYEKIKEWNFDKFQIESKTLTNWNLFKLIKKYSTKDSKILDLGTGGGEKLLKYFPKVTEILGTDFSKEMIETANKNLLKSRRKNISFRIMDNLKMDVPDEYFDIVVARNTVTNPKQIFKCLKKGGYLFIHGVDQHDCHSLKLLFGKGQAFNDLKPISIIDYEKVLEAGFKDVELVPIHTIEYFKNKSLFTEFLMKVPIIDNFSEESGFVKKYFLNEIENEKIETREVNQGDVLRVKNSIHRLVNRNRESASFIVFRFVPQGIDQAHIIKNDKCDCEELVKTILKS